MTELLEQTNLVVGHLTHQVRIINYYHILTYFNALCNVRMRISMLTRISLCPTREAPPGSLPWTPSQRYYTRSDPGHTTTKSMSPKHYAWLNVPPTFV